MNDFVNIYMCTFSVLEQQTLYMWILESVISLH